MSQNSERINQLAEITTERTATQKLMARSNMALLIKSLFLLKVVPEVIDPVMRSFQVGCIKHQNRTIGGDEHPHDEPSPGRSPIGQNR